MTIFEEALRQGAQRLELKLPDQVLENFCRYHAFLMEENKKFNLTTITQPREVAEKHFLDALLIVDQIKTPVGIKMIDIGSGAGFPGLPLKIYWPDLNVVLLESVGKKVNFMRQVIELLQLTGVEAIQARAEDLARTQRQQYHLAVSRAVAEMRVLVEYALPFVRVGGCFIAYKGPDVRDELKQAQMAIQLLGGEVAETKKTCLPLSHDPRTLVIIKKIKPTPEKYPRAAGRPRKKPL